MTPLLLLPAGLAALAALLVPLVIHLARHSAADRIDFAALRWLEERQRPRARWRLDEWLLLAVRLVLIALVALWLARPALTGGATPPWVAVVPGADTARLAAGEAHWLAPGFPRLDAPRPLTPTSGPLPLASLLRQLDAELPRATALTVFVPAVIDGADAERPRLSRPVTWRIVGGTMPARATVRPPPLPLPLMLTVRFAPERAAAVRYLRAAAAAWAPPGTAPRFADGPMTQPLPPSGVVVWLAGPPPAAVRDWIARGGTVLVEGDPAASAGTAVWRDDVGAALVTVAPLGRGRIFRLVCRLDPAAMPQLLDPDFPDRLHALFDPPSVPTRVAAADYAPLTGGRGYDPPARDLRPWLALVLAALFLLERVLATARRGRAA